MMEKNNVKSAIIVSSITFGIGHIVNLLNGADLIPTLFHGVFNTLSIFSVSYSQIWTTILLIVMCLGYDIYINKRVKN